MDCCASIAVSEPQQTRRDGLVLAPADPVAPSLETFGSDGAEILQGQPRVQSEATAA